MESKTDNIAPCKGIRIPESRNFCLWNLQCGALECRIQLKESASLLVIGIWYPSSTDKEVRNLVPKIQNPRLGIQNPKLSWIPLHGAIILTL